MFVCFRLACNTCPFARCSSIYVWRLVVLFQNIMEKACLLARPCGLSHISFRFTCPTFIFDVSYHITHHISYHTIPYQILCHVICVNISFLEKNTSFQVFSRIDYLLNYTTLLFWCMIKLW